MSPKTKGCLAVLAGFLSPVACVVTGLVLVPVQGLPRARIGVVASLDSSTTEGVRMTVMLPEGYGLQPSERGWPALNKPNEAEAVLGREPAEVMLPRHVTYCANYLLLLGPPPPPAWVTLRFSDAPDETYTVWRGRGGDAVVLVNDSSGLEVPATDATWRLTVGRLSSPDPRGVVERRWLLELHVERQTPRPNA